MYICSTTIFYMRKPLLLLLIICTLQQFAFSQIPDNATYLYSIPKNLKENIDYLPGQLICRVKPGKDFSSPLLQKILADYQIQTPQPFFPQAKRPKEKFDAIGRAYVDLTPIYILHFPTQFSIYEIADLLNRTNNFEYVQPKFIFDPLRNEAMQYIPNDANIANQWYLQQIGAYDAWDTHLGDSLQSIAILDGGQDWANPDLQKYTINAADPVDGIDNDGDGYIDNLVGWNTGDNNYDVTAYCASCPHGTAVAGVAIAEPDNNVGVAGVGYYTKFTPIKIANSANQWVGGEAGIFYAAEHNLKIINCSWGSIYYNPVLNDVVQYAAVNKSCLIVASAGNGSPTPQDKYYPAALENVLAVSGTNTADLKLGSTTTGSSYYKEVDITAPAENIFTSYANGFTNVGNGTSFSAPMVSAAAALLNSGIPGLTMLQIEAVLKQKSFDNTTLPGNAAYYGKIGKGRLDINAALNATSYGPYFYFNQRTYTSPNNNLLSIGDTVSLSGLIFNVLENSSPNSRGILRSTSPHILIVDSIFTIGSLPIYGGTNNNTSPYKFVVLNTCPSNQIIEFTWYWEDDIYNNVQHFSVIVNRKFIDITHNNLNTTLGFEGRFGFIDADDRVGLGMQDDNGFQNMLAGTFMIANSNTKVSDAGFSSSVVPFDSDFQTVIPTTHIPTFNGVYKVEGSFNDAGAGANALGVEIFQRAEAVNEVGKENFVLIEYEIENTQNDTLNNVFAGLQSYWNILNDQYFDYSNIASYDATRKMGYAYNPSGNSKYAGITLLSEDPITHYAFNFDGAGGSVNIADGFTPTEKWNTLSGALTRNTSNPGVVLSQVGTGPLEIQPNGKYKIAFALVIGNSLSELQEHADSALAYFQNKWNHWTGAINRDWHIAGNWSKNLVPDSTHKVFISNSTNQPLISNLSTCLDLKIDLNAHLEISNIGVLRVKEQVINNGEILLQDKGQFIQGQKSNYTGTGIFKVRKIYNENSDEYFSLSTPHELLSVIANGITGGINTNAFATSDSISIIPTNCVEGNIAANSPNSNFWDYRNLNATPCLNNGYIVRTSGKVNSAQALRIKLQANDSIIIIGDPSNKNYNISLQQNSNTAKFGHIIGNPYPSRISLVKFLNQNPHIDGAGLAWNEGKKFQIANIYAQPYVYGNKSFWVRFDSTLTNTNTQFNNSMRVSGFIPDTENTASFESLFKIEFKSNLGYENECILVHDLSAIDTYHSNEDLKFTHPNFTFPAIGIKNIADSNLLSLNVISTLHSGMIFPLYIKSDESGDFEIKSTKLGLGDDSLWALIYDHVTQTYHDAENGFSYNLNLNTPNTQGRLSLRFCTRPEIEIVTGNCTGSLHGIKVKNPCSLPLQYYLINATGDTLINETSNNSLYQITGLATGNYNLVYALGQANQTITFIINASNPVQASFTAPTEGFINTPIQFIQTSTGHTSQLWQFGDGMMSTQVHPTHSYINEGLYTVTLISQNNTCSDTAKQQILIKGMSFEENDNASWNIYAIGTKLIVDKVSNKGAYELILVDVSGKELLRKSIDLEVGKNEIEMGPRASGIYLIKIQNTDYQTSKKLILGFGF